MYYLEDYQQLPTKESVHQSDQKESGLSFTGINQHRPREHAEHVKEPSLIARQGNYFLILLTLFTLNWVLLNTAQARARIITGLVIWGSWSFITFCTEQLSKLQ